MLLFPQLPNTVMILETTPVTVPTGQTSTASCSMSSNTKIDYGFYNFSAGEYPDKVNAIALCRGDISPNDCRTCINASSQDLLQACPNQKEAIIWAQKCFVRYSFRSIFGIMEANPKRAYYNIQTSQT
jgi:hypothetical protein